MVSNQKILHHIQAVGLFTEKRVMGHKDYHNLSKIYRFATDYCKLADLQFRFDVDSGH